MKSPKSVNGFTLVEVTLALGISSFCLLAVFGLLPMGVNTSRASLELTGAANFATRISADLQATPSGAVTTPSFQVPIAGDTTLYLKDDGTLCDSAYESRFRARVVTFQGTGGAHAATMARILITWPALAEPARRVDGAFETVIALNRN